MHSIARDKLIVALDVATAGQARDLVSALRDFVGMFKIGSQLFTAAGPGLVSEIVASGARVFLDLKFHDIPNTVVSAGIEAARLRVSIFNVHASGGSEMMRRTADAVSEAAANEGLERPAVIAVTVLTSGDASTLAEIGFDSEPLSHVRRLSLLAEASGMDGVVASPYEVAEVRAAIKSPGFLIVTPGVRPAGGAFDDQRRVMTPAQTVNAGADYLVVGRPIIGARDPVESARRIVEEMESGLASFSPTSKRNC